MRGAVGRRNVPFLDVPPPPEPGDRMLIGCDGGPSRSRLVHFPPPLEIIERSGIYVLVDDGPPHEWRYLFVPNEL
jgi:hypothetical protein